MPTNKPVPSKDPSDLPFNAEKLDQVVNSTASTFTDRKGVARKTLKGITDDLSAAAAITATGINRTAAEDARDEAESLRDETTLLRDAALVGAGPVYATEALGRAAVADGAAFKVQGSGDVAVYEYRRVNSGSSTLIATYPSKEAVEASLLARVQFAVTGSSTFSFTAPNVIGWSTLRFLSPVADLGSAATLRRCADRAAAALPAGDCLYIDLTADVVPPTDYPVTQAAFTAALALDFAKGKKLLLASNYFGSLIGALAPHFVAASTAATAAAASSTASSASTTASNAQTAASAAAASVLTARRQISGRVTSIAWNADGTPTLSIAEGRSYKESNGGAAEYAIAPLADQTLTVGQCLIVDFTAGATDGSGRYIPTKLLAAQASASGWQTANKHILVGYSLDYALFGEYEVKPDAQKWPREEVVVTTSASQVIICMKGSSPNSNKYLRYQISNTPGAAINSNVWRVTGVNEAVRTGDFTFTLGEAIALTGEWETAIRQTGKADFMGGNAHGDEEKFSATLLLDGVAVTLGATGTYKCRRVELLQGSNLYEEGTAKASRLAKAYKRWDFELGGFELRQHVVWEQAVSIQIAYLAMLPLQRLSGAVQISDKGYRSPLYAEENIAASGFAMSYTTANVGKASGPTGYSAEVEVLEGWDKPNRRFYIANDVPYNKFYFDFTGAGYTTTVGETWSARTRYRLDTRN